MRVALLGIPNSGKTLFIAGLYKKFSQRTSFPKIGKKMREKYKELGITRRASLRVRVSDETASSILSSYSIMLAERPIGALPPATLALSKFPLNVDFRFKDMAFDSQKGEKIGDILHKKIAFYDPPGEAFEETNSKSVEILESLDHCDVFMIFLSADIVAQIIQELQHDGENIDDICTEIDSILRLGSIFRHLSALNNRYKDSAVKRIFPVCFVLSKMDLINESLIDKFREVVYENIIMPFTEENTNVLACAAPITVIDGKRNRFAPTGLQWPFFFAAGGALLNESFNKLDDAIYDENHSLSETEAALELEALAERNFILRALRFLIDGETASEVRERAKKAKSRAEGNRILSHAHAREAHDVWSSLGDEGHMLGVRIFSEGREIDDPAEFV